MIATMLLAAMAQVTPLPSQVWKERNHPNMPVLPVCELGDDATIASSLAQLPRDVTDELAGFFGGATPMSDADGPYNSTDVTDGKVPSLRFLRAYQHGRYWVIWYEHGGRVSGARTIALYRSPVRPDQRSAFRIASGTSLGGGLCIATQAIVAGVRSVSP